MTLSDIGKIDRIRARYSHSLASHSGLSLFIYEQEQGLEVAVREDGFSVRTRDGSYLFPVGSDGYKKDFILRHKGVRLIMMREEDVLFTQSVLPDFEAVRDRDRDEYVYDRAEQASLEGHKFQKIRAKLSRFYRENDVVNVPIGDDNIKDAYSILEKWTPKAGEGDAAGAGKALDNFRALGLSGMITYIGGVPSGYCCGGDIGGVYMLCSAKQISDVQGLNLSTKHELFKTLPEHITLINTESDHGSPGIRMHKNDQRPVMMNEVYTGTL